MAFVIADRVRETTTTIGTGSVTLGGAYTSFQTFSAAIGNGNNTYYTIASASSGEWEVGIGTYASGGNLLSRDTVLASSNAGNLVNFSVGSKDVFVTQPAERSLLLQSGGSGLFAGNAAFTANGLLYANATTTATTSSNLTFDGTALTLGGNPTLSAGTANGVAYLNGSKVLTTGSALTFDGSALGVAGRASLTGGGLTGSGNGMHLYFDTGSNTGFIKGFHAGVDDRAIRIDGLNLQFAVAGSEQMRLTSTGLGIGTSSPATKLHIDTASAGYGLTLAASSLTARTYRFGLDSNANLAVFDSIAAAVRLTLDTSGNLGIGTSSPDSKLVVQGGSGTYAQIKDGTVNTFIQARSADSVGVVGTLTNHSLAFWTNSASRMTLDTAGNLGLGVTPSAWGGAYKAIQNGQSGFMSRSGGSDLYLIANSYYDGTNFKYINSSYASRYQQDAGAHAWFTAGVGTAGNAISFTQAMTLDASGNLGVGATSPTNTYSRNVQIDGSSSAGIRFTSTSYTAGFDVVLSAGDAYLLNRNNTSLIFSTNATERARIDSSGNLVLGTTSSLSSSSGRTDLTINGTSTGAIVSFGNGGSRKGYLYQDGTDFSLFNEVSTGAVRFGTNGTERARIDSSGNLLVGTTSSPGTIWSSDRTFAYVKGSATDKSGEVIVESNNGNQQASFFASSGSAEFGLWSTKASAILFGNNNTERARITSGGDLLVGTTSNTGYGGSVISKSAADTNPFAVLNPSATNPYGIAIGFTGAAPNDATRTFLSCADNAATRATIRSNGGIANYQANDVNLSDRREKTNFAPAKSYLDTICAIPVQTFNYIDQNMEEDPGKTLGVVAQDVQAVAPELVMESNWGTKDDPKMRLSVYQTDLQYALMKALQELKAEFDAYKATHP